MLVEERALPHHLDRARATRVEHKAKAVIQQLAHASVGQKAFLLPSGKAE